MKQRNPYKHHFWMIAVLMVFVFALRMIQMRWPDTFSNINCVCVPIIEYIQVAMCKKRVGIKCNIFFCLFSLKWIHTNKSLNRKEYLGNTCPWKSIFFVRISIVHSDRWIHYRNFFRFRQYVRHTFQWHKKNLLENVRFSIENQTLAIFMFPWLVYSW